MARPMVDLADVEIVVRGDLPEGVSDYARTKITALAGYLDEPILHARVRLTQQADRAVARPVRAQANLDLDRRQARAQAAGATGTEAVDLVVDRLRDRLLGLARHWEAVRGRQPANEPHEWRHGNEPTHRPPYYPRPAEQRQLIKHKAFAPARINPSEAAWEMDQMDYGFHVFTEATTGTDAVVYRGGPTGYRLARVAAGPKSLDLVDGPLTLSPHPAPRLTVAEATARLDVSGWPFVFFEDAGAERGSVLYRRYDGHYGLVTPPR